VTQPTLESFFSGGGKSVSWKDKPLGTMVSGIIKTVHPPQVATDPVTNQPQISKRTGQPKMQVRIELLTNERDPQDPDDDGLRNLYVGGWMQGAIGDALRKAGVQGPPEVGGQLTVTLTERQPNENPVLAPINKFQATYVPASAQATGQFFNGSQPQAPVGPPPQPTPVPGFQGAYAPPGGYPQHMQPQAQQPVPQQAAPQQPQQYPGYVGAPAPVPPGTPEPQRPQAISEAAWNAMDPAARIQVAKTMADLPPF